MMSAKLVTLHLLKIKGSWNNGYAVTISACHVTNKVLSPDSNYIVDVVMWPTSGSFSVSMREAIITSNIRNLSLRVPVEWFGSGTSVAKKAKLKVRNIQYYVICTVKGTSIVLCCFFVLFIICGKRRNPISIVLSLLRSSSPEVSKKWAICFWAKLSHYGRW